MTKVRKPVRRETLGTIYEIGKHRPVIVSIEPPNVIGFRLKGTRRTYYLTVEGLYVSAVKAHIAVERRERARLRQAKRKGGA